MQRGVNRLSLNERKIVKCHICASETSDFYDPIFDTNYHHCPICEFIQMETEKIVTFKEERKIYDYHENSLEDEGYVNMFKNFIDQAVIPYINKGTVLDFGSGPEPVLAQLLNRDYEFEVEHYDLHYQPEKVYEGKTYDVVLSTEVVEHLQNPMEYFNLFHSLLKEGGILSFMTLFHNNDEEAFLEWQYRRDVTHISFYSLKTLSIIAKMVGFELIYTDNRRLCTFKKF